jgi:hypothetical protein
MSQQTKKTVRSMINKRSDDPSSIQSQSWNMQTGAQKNMEMGHRLVPISLGTTFTTAATTIRAVPKGITLAIYNPTGTAISARVSQDPAATALAIGAVDAVTGDVGVAVPPNSYLYLATFNCNYIITGAGAITYVVADDTVITDQAQVK